MYTANYNNSANVEEIVNENQLEEILNTSAAQVSKWCQKACLKPKKDGFGNVYFSKSDIDVLKKVKELYENTRLQTDIKRQKVDTTVSRMEREAGMRTKDNYSSSTSLTEGNFLTSARSRFNRENAVATMSSLQLGDVSERLDNLENNIVTKISNILSEKMDGLDEVVVELIRVKTENETLRQRLNELNKENFCLKSENASYKSLGLGLYIKKGTDDDFVL